MESKGHYITNTVKPQNTISMVAQSDDKKLVDAMMAQNMLAKSAGQTVHSEKTTGGHSYTAWWHVFSDALPGPMKQLYLVAV